MKKPLFLYVVAILIPAKNFAQDHEPVEGSWNGTASLVEKLSGEFISSERHIDFTIKDNKVTGTVKYVGDIFSIC